MRVVADKFTFLFVMLAVTIITYLLTWEPNTPSLELPMLLLLSGIVLTEFFGKKIKTDSTISEKETKTTVLYAGAAFGAMLLASMTIPNIFRPTLAVDLSTTGEFLYGQLYAISEEMFFRGAVTAFVLSQLPTGLHLPGFSIPTEAVASGIGGTVFGIYHLARYGVSEAFWFVVFAGATLTFITLIAFKERRQIRLAPAILGHMLNNGSDVIFTFLRGILP